MQEDSRGLLAAEGISDSLPSFLMGTTSALHQELRCMIFSVYTRSRQLGVRPEGGSASITTPTRS